MPELTQALILGVVQGLTEFLPISSSAHLVLVPWLLGWESPLLNSLTFTVATHMGTLVAVLAYFWHDWLGLAGGAARLVARRDWQDTESRLAVLIVVGCVPAVVAGVLFDEIVEGSLRDPLLIAATLALFSLALFGAERLGRGRKPLSGLGLPDALGIGFAQAVAIVPGVSRSGATISAGLLLGLERTAAARFSFLLSTPVVAGAGAKKLFDLRAVAVPSGDWALMIVGALAAGISGWLCIRWLLAYLARDTMDPFVAYRLGLAALVIAVYLARGW